MKKTTSFNLYSALLKCTGILFIAAPLFLLGGCSSMSGDDTASADANVEDRSANDGENAGNYEGQTGGYDGSGMADGSSMSAQLSDPNSPLSIRTIYFEHDSSQINSQGQSTLNAHAEFLSLNPNQQVVIEGHTDETGTRDYNLSLGEQRGNSVVDFLSASGVPNQQMEVRSFGEENPVSLDQSESARQLNRRVELIY
ncbi:MAG: OmpA family protein [gamma proteobacterium symbiont of Taylorina sp.]|nr:OmpA family protein [gamma proteobacterium symbiont of Taylorina sp.]